ncbi:unnamed protein product [Medioppia subpectinata]|uniref:RBR-type E3 ubiquitin transferase n=1 Tax=Medioppia subpectinata TaxID=1979941 RepID=A0A7R9QDV5_9ACAR|nr:unnamed protein product [Medioppia subpectinata]CAG2119088.1 unnamed protein product [Medioppia subpectinata]
MDIMKLEIICYKLESLWKESKMEILFTWFSFLQNDVMDYLKTTRLNITYLSNVMPKMITKSESNLKCNETKVLTTTLSKASVSNRDRRTVVFKPSLDKGIGTHDRRAVCDLMGRQLITYLIDYNEHKRKETFNKSYITCNICFSPHLGEDCVVFPCLHINCKNCIANYFTTLINEGTVNQLKCPETECQTTAPPNVIRDLVSEELFKKYDKIMLETLIGTMSDVYYCPRKTCGTVVIGDPDSSLAHCSACGYAFCKNCNFTYHGFDPCSIFRDAQQRKLILEKYTYATAEEKLEIEKVYGKKQIASALEEAATDKWMEDMSKRCPHCRASIEKSDGCNKMSCWRCNTCFCWLCLTQLPLTQPYSHFSNPMSKCYNQLFQGVNFDIDDMFEDFDI